MQPADEVEYGEEEQGSPVHMRHAMSPLSTMYRPRKCRRFIRNYGSFAAEAYKRRDVAASVEGHPYLYGGNFQNFRGHNTYLKHSIMS